MSKYWAVPVHPRCVWRFPDGVLIADRDGLPWYITAARRVEPAMSIRAKNLKDARRRFLDLSAQGMVAKYRPPQEADERYQRELQALDAWLACRVRAAEGEATNNRELGMLVTQALRQYREYLAALDEWYRREIEEPQPREEAP